MAEPVARIYSAWSTEDKKAFKDLKDEATKKLGIDKIKLADFIMAVEPGHPTPDYLLEA
jgi:hypothetical protein